MCPSERRKGYAKVMWMLGLEYAKTIGLSQVMLGRYCTNIASIRVIESCGGGLSECKPNVDGEWMNIYKINLE